MKTAEAIKIALSQSDMVWQAYVGDLTDDEFLDRAVPGLNHIAWQLGHLIASEHQMINGICPGACPALPEGFAEQHGKDTADSDDPSAFLSKQEYLDIAAAQREGTLSALASLAEDDFDKPGPAGMEGLCPNVGSTFLLQASHYLMHAGQWAVLRRKHGRQPLF